MVVLYNVLIDLLLSIFNSSDNVNDIVNSNDKEAYPLMSWLSLIFSHVLSS